MADYLFRTEDLTNEEILRFFVASESDRFIVDKLKGRSPIILVGSRGMGKSFLLKIAAAELSEGFDDNRILPVYITFNKSALVELSGSNRFSEWMLAKIAVAILRELGTRGLLLDSRDPSHFFSGSAVRESLLANSKLELLIQSFEDGWQRKEEPQEGRSLPDIELLKSGLQEVCEKFKVQRICILIDEAAHILLPRQQRAFFTLFRDLRSPYLTCNAAVYPGTTAYGDVFEPVHDATFISLTRDVLAKDYIQMMREIVIKQSDTAMIQKIEQNPSNFSILAYAATGNPRILLKTVASASRLSSSEVSEVIRSYYRTEIWSEHSSLTERYSGLSSLIDWGRNYLESTVLPALQAKNDERSITENETSAFFWTHRDIPEGAKEAIRILCYGGMVYEHSAGMKATRSEIGTRYLVNLGCLLALEKSAVQSGLDICTNLDVRKMVEFGQNHPVFRGLADFGTRLNESAVRDGLKSQLAKSVDVLDITEWQKSALKSISIQTISGVLTATEFKLQEAYYVGEVRSRRIRNAAVSAVLEYLSG